MGSVGRAAFRFTFFFAIAIRIKATGGSANQSKMSFPD